MAFNQLTPAEIERLAILAEECGEVIQIIGKVLRHGYESTNPQQKHLGTNRDMLTKEIGDVLMAADFIIDFGDVDRQRVLINMQEKYDRIRPYLHHN